VRPRTVVCVDASERTTVSQAGAVVLLNTVRAVGLDRELSLALASWLKPLAVHDPAKVLCGRVRQGRLRPGGVPAGRHLGS